MIALLTLLACGPGEPSPVGPSPQASEAAAEAFCKLFTGARQACEQEGPVARAVGREVRFDAVIEDFQSTLGFSAAVLRITPTLDGTARPELATPAAANAGQSMDELLGAAIHEWAVVHGVALADALLADPDRPALRALTPEVQSGRALPGYQVFRGWTRLQGGSDVGLDHDQVLTQLQPFVATLTPGWHALTLRLDHEPGNARYRCELDGVESAELCEAARRYAWPVGGPLTRVRQYYLLVPEEAP